VKQSLITLSLVMSISSQVCAQAREYSHHKDEKPIEEFWGGKPPQPYEHALVFNGIGLDVGVHAGILDALIDGGKKPDLIIGTCGGGVAAGIHRAFPDADTRLQFITSKEFHEFIIGPYKVENGANPQTKLQKLGLAISAFMRKYHLRNKVKNYFGETIANLPQDAIPSEFDSPMSPTQDGTHYITLAARTSLTEENVKTAKIRGQKYYNEVLFTDAETAPYLKNYSSPIEAYFPNSLVKKETIVKSNETFGVAIRMGVADPFIFAPGKFDDGYYLTGGINLNPVELAKGMAKEVTFLFRDGFDPAFNALTEGGAFMYDTRERQRIVSGNSLNRWVDLTDRPFWTGFGFSVTAGITDDYETFRAMILKQYILGYVRANESLCYSEVQADNYKGHLRYLPARVMAENVRDSIQTANRVDRWKCVRLPKLQAELEKKFGVQLPPLENSLKPEKN
jgi:Patatin-like phospholipase